MSLIEAVLRSRKRASEIASRRSEGAAELRSVIFPPEREAERQAVDATIRKSTRGRKLGEGVFLSCVYPQSVQVRLRKSSRLPMIEIASGRRRAEIAILKSVDGDGTKEEARYTLGVAYPVGQIDAHGDTIDAGELERAAWEFMADPVIGLMHRDGSEGHGRVVESYISRSPDFELAGEVVRPGDWLIGAIWEPETWAAIKAGQIRGYSLQGWGERAE